MKISKYSSSVITVLVILSCMFLLTSCAHKEVVSQCLTGHTYGFWSGLWHGIIAPFDFIASFIWDDITMYAQNNNGAWYAFGFLIGSGGWGFMGGKGIFRKRG
jgi:hypothetical protein